MLQSEKMVSRIAKEQQAAANSNSLGTCVAHTQTAILNIISTFVGGWVFKLDAFMIVWYKIREVTM